MKHEEPQHIEIGGGTGVGIVTKTGLPVAVGEAAINPVPRKMIIHEVSDVLSNYKINVAVKVIISVPDGEQIARLTMNARLGITGGISILGTRGIVIPFSSAAYRASLAVTIKAAAENGLRHLVLTTGGRSENYAMKLYPELAPMSFIEAGEFVGFSLKKCETYKIKKITLSGMIGKLSKVAAGVLMVHSSKSSIDFSFLADIATEAGANIDVVEKIKQANTAGEVAEWMKSEGLMEFFNILTRYCCKVCSEKVQGQMEIETLLFTLDGELLSRSYLPRVSGLI
jgi:cobalt-precorrin-5B (C1)-methyltransferase